MPVAFITEEKVLKILNQIQVADAPWEDGERILTINGSPVGSTISGSSEAERWWPSLKHEIAKIICEKIN